MTLPGTNEYRLAHLRERLAGDEIAELGVRIEMRGSTVLLHGTVSTSACRDEILRIAEEALRGLPVRADLVVADATAPDHPEDLA
ncbi:hypothetical protein [Streptomyces sp. GC420]|uniref:hypothetical protein n=1 Tax=Streptomyces sp. GC420 TaxID=2697568 RepID=UPI001414DCF3|nr:hypothetical protein [Streptomyces sp. GC420]NBM18243.1 hypothetical protein [Streptomyces sp. GC420]